MNKGSHISLAHFLMEDIYLPEVASHRKAFLVGSILPDCLPSFLTTRHTITDTFELLTSEIEKIYNIYKEDRAITPYYCRHLGIICHYIADYFTFPHNPGFTGSVKEHYYYEKELQVEFRQYLFDRRNIADPMLSKLNSSKDISSYILEKHNEYLKLSHEIIVDCRFIIQITYITVRALLDKLYDTLPVELGGQEGQIQAA